MQDEKQVRPGQFVVSVGESGGGDLPDYQVLAAEEAIKANIVDLKEVPGMFADEAGNIKQQLKFTFKVAEGQDGAGQTYGFWVNAPTSNTISPKSSLFKVLSKVYSDNIEGVDVYDMLGKPVRIELSEPYPSKKNPDKKIQRITAVKSPTKDQEAIAVEVPLTPEDAFRAAITVG